MFKAGVRGLRYRLLGNSAAAIGLVLAVAVVAAVLVGPLLVSRGPLTTDPGNALRSPFSGSLLGTDELGRDLLSRVLVAGRVSLGMAGAAVGISSVIGGALGYVSGYVGGPTDTVTMRVMDSLLAFPPLLLAVLIAGSLGSGVGSAIIAIGVMGVPAFARVARAEALRIESLEFIDAAKVAGVRQPRILIRHVVRNGISPLVILAATRLAQAILTAAALDYLGLGEAPPSATWGGMLRSGFPFVEQDAWLGIIPGVAIAITALAFVFIGDGLRDALDPRGSK